MMQKQQRGLTLISWVIVLSLVGIQVIAAMRIIPVYVSYYSAKKIMDDLAQDHSARGMGAKELQVTINKRININGLHALERNRDAFSYQQTPSGVAIALSYEERGPILGNLEFVATFEYQVEVPKQ